jgi:hypothetical protein
VPKTIQRLRAEVHLDAPRQALADATAQADRGDDDWRQWVDEYRRGEALIVRLEVWVEFATDEPHLLHVRNCGVWVERTSNAPKLEAQIAEIVDKDYDVLAEELRQHGFHCDSSDLASMYVHIELQDDVKRLLESGRAGDGDPDRPTAEVGLSRADPPRAH